MIPFIPPPSLADSPLRQATPSARDLSGPAAALGDVARGIAAVGGAFAEHAEQIQGFENARMESEARQRIAAEIAEFKTRMETATDPGSFLPELDKTIERTTGIAEDPNLPPVIRERLAIWHSNAAAQTRLGTAAEASRLSLRRAGLALQNEMDAAVQYGDPSAFEDILTRGQEAGLIMPEEADAKRRRFAEVTTYNTMARQIDADPQAALEELQTDDFAQKVPNLTETNRQQLIRYATTRSNQQKAQTWEQVQIASMEGKILSREEVMAMAKEGDLTASQAGSYIRAYHGPAEPQFEPLVYEQARNLIHAYDPSKDPSGAGRAALAQHLATTPLPKSYMQELSRQYSEKMEKPSAPKHKLASEYNDRINSEWTTEQFGNWFDEVKNETTGRFQQIISEKDFDAALSYKTKVKDNFMQWLKTQPDDLDPIDAGKKYQEIKTQVLQNLHPPLDLSIPSLAPAPVFDDPIDITPAPSTTDPKTSSIIFPKPIKLSNYGYASDLTPDSWSAKGIGHANNKLIDGTSAAITKSLANDLGLKSGDWFIARTTRGAFRLRYDDTVPSYDKRTGALPPTIDVYRKTSGSNNWGGKVLAIEKIEKPQKISDIRTEKSRLFREMRPTTPDAASAIIEQIHNLASLDTLDA
jgi:hypothetical protein